MAGDEWLRPQSFGKLQSERGLVGGEEKKLPAQLSGVLHKKVKHKNAGLSPSQESLFLFFFKAFLYCGTDTPSL